MKDDDYCKCESVTATYTDVGEFGYTDMCSECGKPLEDGFHYHDDPELY